MSLKGGDEPKTTVVNPWEHMPGWQKDYYKDEAQRLTQLYQKGGDIADYLEANPTVLSGLTGAEQQSLQDYLDTVAAGQGVGDYAMGQVQGTGNRARDIVGYEAGMQPTSGADMDAIYERFENPYTEDVINATTRQIERDAARAQAARGASQASIGGLGGTRAAVADALAQQLTGETSAKMGAELRAKGFTDARNLGMAESSHLAELGFNRAELGLQAEQLGLTEAQLMDQLVNSSVQRQGAASAATQAQEVQRRQIADANRESSRTAARDAASWYGGLFASNKGISAPNPQAFASGGGEGTAGTGQMLGTMASIAGIAAMVMSDEEAKADIVPVEDESALEALTGLPLYEYRYADGLGHTRDRTRGLLAQDVERVLPEAVREDPLTGLKQVDLYPVVATVAKAVRELDARTRPGAGL
jgi:hypothetical protein